MTELDALADSFTGFAAAVPRIAVAFVVLPLLTREVVPAIIRNVFVFSLGLSLYPLISATADLADIAAFGLVQLVIKEAVIGLMIAYLFSIIFWALEGAGEIIDAKIGSTTAQLADPVLGHQTTMTATFFSRLAAFLFVALGGLSVFLGLLLQSYAVWPIDAPIPVLQWSDDLVFVKRFSDLFAIMLVLAAPVLIVLSLIEFAFGLVNRFAERLNVFSISMSVKAWVAILIVVFALSSIVEYVLRWLATQTDLLDLLSTALPAG
ncbi:MAG: type III secretion system export apparatus subunit SctT [Woeseiaceae bacterium]